MWVVVTHFTESEYGPELTNVIGPFETFEQAKEDGYAWYLMMEAKYEFAQVHDFEVRPIRTFDQAEQVFQAVLWSGMRTDPYNRVKDDDKEWP
jgi:hypothetical protein